MTTEQIVRDQLQRATQEVLGGPDLDTSIRHGRRRRRTTRVGAAIAAVAVLGCGAVGVHALTGDDPRAVVQDSPAAGAPAPAAAEDFVPGTDIDRALAAVVAAHLPSLPAPDDVYPSDSHTSGPMPDADFAQAEDWQAAYTLPDGHGFLLITALASEGPFSCQDCEQQAVPGGTVYREVSTSLQKTQYGTWYVRDDGSLVGAFEFAPVQGNDRDLSDTDLATLAQDPGLTLEALSGA